MSLAVAITTAWMLGLSGSTHCAIMCGPLASVLSGSGRCWTRSVATQLGRATTYVVLGAVLGATGGHLASRMPFVVAGIGSRLLVAGCLIVAGFSLLGFGSLWRTRFAHALGLTRGSSSLHAGRLRAFTGRIRQALTHHLASPSSALGFVRGLAWGFLPCGLLYAALGLAVAAGSAGAGAATMGAFALSTFPVFGLLRVFSVRLGNALRRQRVQRTAGLVLVLAGMVHLALLVQEHQSTGIDTTRPCCATRPKDGV